jgi:hypothetical protein
MTILYSQLLGGIGNMLFIVANLYSLSIDRNMDFCVSNNTISCTKRKDENFWLNSILQSVKKVKNRPKNIKYKYKEIQLNYRRIPQTKGQGLELVGYYQTEKYFKHNKEKIIELFTKYKRNIQKELDNIFGNEKSICIHIRRGDYLKLKHTYVIQSMDYYKNSLQKMISLLKYENLEDMNKDYRIVIFSDDINWCKNQEIFKNIKNKKFINTKCAVKDLYLMSMCEHYIIANSSYSWWGSYLNKNDNKIVIAPSQWYNTSYKIFESYKDIYCEDWIII